MKRQGFKYMITGFLFILLDIHAFIDVLPDPVGYLLIGLGTLKIVANGKNAKKAEITAYILMIFSIPTLVFSGEVLQQMQTDSTGWQLYGFVLSMGHLILMYFVFLMLLHEVEYLNDEETVQLRVHKMMRFYMAITLSSAFIQPFLMNVNKDLQLVVGIPLIVVTLIAQIIFIVHLRGLQKTFPNDFGRIYPVG